MYAGSFRLQRLRQTLFLYARSFISRDSARARARATAPQDGLNARAIDSDGVGNRECKSCLLSISYVCCVSLSSDILFQTHEGRYYTFYHHLPPAHTLFHTHTFHTLPAFHHLVLHSMCHTTTFMPPPVPPFCIHCLLYLSPPAMPCLSHCASAVHTTSTLPATFFHFTHCPLACCSHTQPIDIFYLLPCLHTHSTHCATLPDTCSGHRATMTHTHSSCLPASSSWVLAPLPLHAHLYPFVHYATACLYMPMRCAVYLLSTCLPGTMAGSMFVACVVNKLISRGTKSWD